MRRFTETYDRPFTIEWRVLFHLEDGAHRKFACEIPVRAQRVRIDCLHRWKTRFEIEIEKRQHHLVAVDVFALRGHAASMPERLLIRSLESMIVGIEWLDTLRRVGVV